MFGFYFYCSHKGKESFSNGKSFRKNSGQNFFNSGQNLMNNGQNLFLPLDDGNKKMTSIRLNKADFDVIFLLKQGLVLLVLLADNHFGVFLHHTVIAATEYITHDTGTILDDHLGPYRVGKLCGV